jgi:LuxR family maltose regulon positive regulatory protein
MNVLRSYQKYSEGYGESAVEKAENAILQLPPDSHIERGQAMIYLAVAHQMVGNAEQAHKLVYQELAIESSQRSTTYHSRLLASLCFVDWMEADLFLLEKASTQLVQVGDEVGLPESSAVGRYFVGIVRYHLNDLPEAESSLKTVVSANKVANMEFYAQSIFALASIHQARGEIDKANELVDSFCEQIFRRRNTAVLSLARAFQADLAFRQGHFAKALDWVRKFDPEPFEPMYRFQAPQMTLARILVSLNSDNSHPQAGPFLEHLESFLTRTHNRRFLIEVLALRALLLQKQGKKPEAISTLGKAVSLAHSSGFIRLFVDLGPDLAVLFRCLDSSDEEQSRYIKKIITAFQGSESSPVPAYRSPIQHQFNDPILIESLTNREMEILELFHKRLTNKEIGKLLFISPATVKRHAENIYSKLGVNGRREAITVAKQLKILES